MDEIEGMEGISGTVKLYPFKTGGSVGTNDKFKYWKGKMSSFSTLRSEEPETFVIASVKKLKYKMYFILTFGFRNIQSSIFDFIIFRRHRQEYHHYHIVHH